jgi:hypothetical protein
MKFSGEALMMSHISLALLGVMASSAIAVASPVQAPVTSPVASAEAQSALQRRFENAQKIARPGLPSFEVRIADGQSSFFAQRNDGIVRLPGSIVASTSDPAIIDAMALIGLSYATRRRPEAAQLSKTAKILTGVAGFVGREIAEREALRTGAKQTDLLAQPVVNNGERLADPQNPMLRGMIWAKANGACEAKIVAALKSMAGQNRDAVLQQDARGMLRALGSVAWSPDDRCGG